MKTYKCLTTVAIILLLSFGVYKVFPIKKENRLRYNITVDTTVTSLVPNIKINSRGKLTSTKDTIKKLIKIIDSPAVWLHPLFLKVPSGQYGSISHAIANGIPNPPEKRTVWANMRTGDRPIDEIALFEDALFFKKVSSMQVSGMMIDDVNHQDTILITFADSGKIIIHQFNGRTIILSK